MKSHLVVLLLFIFSSLITANENQIISKVNELWINNSFTNEVTTNLNLPYKLNLEHNAYDVNVNIINNEIAYSWYLVSTSIIDKKNQQVLGNKISHIVTIFKKECGLWENNKTDFSHFHALWNQTFIDDKLIVKN